MGFFSNLFNFFTGLVRSRNVAQTMQTRFKIPEDMMGMIEVWQDMYMAESGNGKDQRSGLCSMIANDLAKKVMSELRIGVSYGGVSDFDIGLFDDDDMITLRGQVEYAIAMGGSLMRPIVRDGRVVQEWYTPDRIIPTDWDRRTMTGVTLIDYFNKQESSGSIVTYAKLEAHGWSDDGRYHIRTKAFKNFALTSTLSGFGSSGYVGKEVPLSEVPDWAEITPDIIIDNPAVPTFVYIGTPFSNNKVFNQPLGVSIFKDAIPWITEFEQAFRSAREENRHGRSRLFVAENMISERFIPSVKDDDKGVWVDDLSELDKEFVRKLQTESSNDLFEQWAPALRFDSFEKYMNFLLHVICLLCGLDPSQYVFDEKVYAVTAREVISKQQKTYATICDLQRYMITPAVSHIVECVRQIQYLYDLPAIPENIEISCDYGDSILVDEQLERENALLEVNSKLRSKLSYLMTQRGLTEEEAKAEIERINEESQASMPTIIEDGFGA